MVSPLPTPRSLDRYLPLQVHLALIGICFVLLVHNYGINLLPYEQIEMQPPKIRPHAESSFTYTYNYSASFPDRDSSHMSRVRLSENGQMFLLRLTPPTEVLLVGGGRWSHLPGRILFTSLDNTDPRENGRRYIIHSPLLYHSHWGRTAAAGFAAAVAGLYWRTRGRQPAPALAAPAPQRVRWLIVLAAIVLVAGLYCNTGTLPPYANTYPPYVHPETGYLYNNDHPHFRALFDFVDGQPRETWNGAIMLRRILFPVLAWPAMKLWGFELGGTVTGLLLTVLAFMAVVELIRRQIGPRGAALAAGLLALYPGITYWSGLPYTHVLIIPLSLLLTFALRALQRTSGARFVLISLAMGLAYLGYDLLPYFVPAAALVLAVQRRWAAIVVSTLLQLGPLVLWLAALRLVFHQPVANSNSGSYAAVLSAYRHIRDIPSWWAEITHFPDVGLNVFFAANFIFLPALFLALLPLNAVTSRVRLAPEEGALLLAGLVLFLVNNLSPPYGGWSMRGTWIARLYQPLFPVLLLFIARWWQHCPPLGRARHLVTALVALTALGQGLVVFGPILNNPGGVSERAFYGFYNHTQAHFLYEYYLRQHGRRPFGF